ncbi:MAG TPA: ABC transporter substrate-binding protein [Candidatus Binatia bacterium]|nr:ABC transporter substrate-binding protein [Candidatus Binatia bacterium]
MIAPRQLFSSILVRLRAHTLAIGICCFLAFLAGQLPTQAQTKKVRVAVPGYTIAVLSFLAAKTNGYYTSEGLDVELIAMRAPTANLALLGGNVEFSAVPLAGLTTAVRGAPLKLIFCQFDKPQHSLFARAELQNVRALRGKKLAVSGLGTIDDILLREALAGNGVDPGRDVTILAMGAADTRFAALASGAIDASVLIAPVSFYAKEQGFKELAAFQDLGFVLPSGGIVARDETLKTDSVTAERFVRATIMGFLYMRDNRAGTLKVMSRMLRIDDATAAKLYDSSRPTMTNDGTVSGEAEKKMTAMVLKIAAVKEPTAADKLYDFALVKKAHLALQARGWRPGP